MIFTITVSLSLTLPVTSLLHPETKKKTASCRFNDPQDIVDCEIVNTSLWPDRRKDEIILKDIYYPLLVDCDPICCGKPFVVLDIVDSVFQVAVPLGEVHLQQVPQQVFQITAEVRGNKAAFLGTYTLRCAWLCTFHGCVYGKYVAQGAE